MPVAYIQAVQLENPGLEEPAATRERLKDRFPKGATRRMTQLGMLVGATLEPLAPAKDDTLIYTSEFAETRALESYLDSFPSASPTLFQTSIHPSAVQQLMIQRQQPVNTFFPMTGRSHLVAQALEVALFSEGNRTILCGGEERGTWLLENKAASEHTFAFSLSLTAQDQGSLGRIALQSRSVPTGELSLFAFFQALQQRRPLELAPAPGRWLTLTWS